MTDLNCPAKQIWVDPPSLGPVKERCIHLPPKDLRVSIGTAIVLSLMEGMQVHPPTTAYIMFGERCVNNCSFCAQAADMSERGDMLSRVIWPPFRYDEVLSALSSAKERGMGRLCLQCLTDPVHLRMLPEVVRDLREASGLPVSLSLPPTDRPLLQSLKETGADRVGIALDAATEALFDRNKGGGVGNACTWQSAWSALGTAVDIFGERKVTTHLIIGLGETDREAVALMTECRSRGIVLSLFAYTRIKGRKDAGRPPTSGRYRALQIARHLVFEEAVTEEFHFDVNGKLVGLPEGHRELQEGPFDIFSTKGCPDCNRPYYNERPGGTIYNHPHPLSREEHGICYKEALLYVR